LDIPDFIHGSKQFGGCCLHILDCPLSASEKKKAGEE